MGSGKSRQYSTMAEEYAAEKERLIAGCNFCGDCLEVCPVFPYRSDQKQGTVEVQEEIVRVLEGHDGTNVAKEQAFSCSSCGMCITSCPQGLNPFRLREILKAELVRCGYHPPSAIAQPKIGGKIYDLPQVIGSLQIKPSQVRWLTGTPRHPQPRETVIFLGCNVLQMPDKMIALLGLLD
ncbi:MAG: (Fe-S)-binding protein, partial [Dehalococcoidia bacterium]|nr:(Fe-S)-binding protein [Dehalococcoidia bacterium]